MKHDITHALTALRPGTSWILTGDTPDGLEWIGPGDPPTLEELEAKIAELDSLEPMRLLRLERDKLISSTDWWVLPDRTPTTEQLAYRQALRDITVTSTPALGDDGRLDPNSVSWPVRP